MKLSQLLQNEFDRTIRQRGASYFSSGLVRLAEGSPRTVKAIVRGSEKYQVTLTRKQETIEASCSCPYTDSFGEPCKHLWAVVLAADAKGYLLGDPVRGSELYLDLVFLDDDDSDYDPNEDADEDADVTEDLTIENNPTAQALNQPPGDVTAKKAVISKILDQAEARFGKADPGGKTEWKAPQWKKALNTINRAHNQLSHRTQAVWPDGRELIYVIDVTATLNGQGLAIELLFRDRRKDGEWSKLKSQRIPSALIQTLPDPLDREILAVLLGARETYSSSAYSDYFTTNSFYESTAPIRYQLNETIQPIALPLICRTGRCRMRRDLTETELPVIGWDEGEPWQFWLKFARHEAAQQYVMTGELRRPNGESQEIMPLHEPTMLTFGGLLFLKDRAARFDHLKAFNWIPYLRQTTSINIPFGQEHDFFTQAGRMPEAPKLDLPEELNFEAVRIAPRPMLKLRPDHKRPGLGNPTVIGDLSFDYDGSIVSRDRDDRGFYRAAQKQLLLRDPALERKALEYLYTKGFREQKYYSESKPVLELTTSKVPRVVRDLVEQGWQVEAEGKLYRRPGKFEIAVSSGIDWFELRGSVDYDGASIKLPELLAALKRGENTVRLGDGTFGLLPEEWLEKFGLFAGLGTAEADHLRFTRAQTGFLDMLLAQQPDISFDETFARARDELKNFAGIEAADAPVGFRGELRGYQREGLGWLNFLRRFGFGGCLADDMGLGKTIQILALLEARREQRTSKTNPTDRHPTTQPAPSLVVVPKSLVFNWQQEAAKFTPQLRVLDHTGIERNKESTTHFDDYDLILTTYGTLRNDAVLFKDVLFDYVILDEAQAIKNANTESAKAARLLRGSHKLGLSGTPVENHLGELWSLFEFLNPGLLGAASALNLGGGAGRNPDEETRRLLATALRPFILRRTKDQVAKDLPPKLEQTIYCEMEPAQRKRYHDLKEHYRNSLLKRIDEQGINKSKMHVLEALLRLRQAACHPGLIDKTKTSESSAKLEVLVPQLIELMDENHKTLVFSQFTSLLAIVKEKLDQEGLTYEYLDGRTRNRAERVARFQTDPDCKLFLISLKAGGLGLNLTAAEYVFLLDPWWNPAVEAQAIDRAHRIGQTQQVFAYRLITRDTVEEKVLELQHTKRELADAIINADNSLIRSLKREDLEMLLS